MFDLSFTLDTTPPAEPEAELDPASDTSPARRSGHDAGNSHAGWAKPSRTGPRVAQGDGASTRPTPADEFTFTGVPLGLGENRITLLATDLAGLTSRIRASCSLGCRSTGR